MINPNYEVAESDYTNNIMKCKCRYDGYRLWTYNCQTGEVSLSAVRSNHLFSCCHFLCGKNYRTEEQSAAVSLVMFVIYFI